MKNENHLNISYLLGTALVHVGAVVQIIKIFQTQSAEDIAIFWMIAILLGHIFHVPRSFSSHFWVWKLNCSMGIILSLMILVQVILWG